MKFKATTALAVVLAAAAFAMPASAQNVIRWASQGDALTSDPHAANESPTHSASRKVYDTLTYNDKDMVLTPWLATSWRLTDDPTVWEFELRKGVKFHDGSDMTATDVKFSFDRAKSETSDISGDISSIKEIKIINDHKIQFITNGPDPILPNLLTNTYIMSKAWSTILSSATERRNRLGVIGSDDVGALATSSGNSKWTAPGFSVRAIRTALRTISGIVSAFSIVVAHFVTGRNMATTSMI